MKRTYISAFAACLAAIISTLTTALQAQTTANWNGNTDSEWTTAGNWDVGVPAEGTNAVVTGGNTPSYDFPMTATSFASLTLGITLNVNTNGFNILAPGTTNSGGANFSGLAINSGGTMNITSNGIVTVANSGTNLIAAGGVLSDGGSLTFSNCLPLTIVNAATPVLALNVLTNSVLTFTNSPGSVSLNVGTVGNSGSYMSINGGTVTLDKVLSVAGTNSKVLLIGGTLNALGGVKIAETGNDQAERLGVGSGTVNMGNFSVYRSTSAGGLQLTNGVVNATGVQIGVGNSAAFGEIYGGVLTNTGVFTVSDNTNAASSGDRRSQCFVRGGSVYSTAVGGIVIANQSNITNTAARTGSTGIGGIIDVSSGSLTAEMITLIKDNTITNAYARLSVSSSGIVYLGSGGLVANTGLSNCVFAVTSTNGTFGAKADWSSSAPMTLNGAPTFKAADAAGVAHNITLSGVLSGSGAAPTKTGGGTLTLNTNDTYTGNTTISAGTLALGATGSITNTPQITIAAGASFDVSAVPAASLVGSQILNASGSVVGSLAAGTGTSIRPGGAGVAGTASFSSVLNETGGVINGFDLSADPTGLITPNDFINVAGDLDVSGTNTLLINPLAPLPSGATYKLFHYGGNFNGGLTNFLLSGAAGSLTQDSVAKTISLITAGGVRGPTNVTWLGNPATNNWDLLTTSNWLVGVTRDWFVSGDIVRFDDTGASNPIVNVVGSVGPNSTTVDTSSNYTFTGSGSIDGFSGLTKTNSGTLTILTTNNFPGPIIIGGGTLEASRITTSGSASGIGASGNDPSNLVFYGSTLRDLGGSSSTDHGATLNGTGATIDIASNATTLTMSGTLTGAGGLTKVGPGGLTVTGTGGYAGLTTISNGTLSINGSTGSIGTNDIVFAGGTLSMNLGSQPTYANNLDIVANSSITSGGGNNNIVSGAWTGSGPLVMAINMTGSNGTFTVNGLMDNFTGTVMLVQTNVNLQTFRFNSGGGNTSFGAPNTTIDLGTNAGALQARNTGTMVIGALQGGPNTQLLGQGAGTGNLTWVIGSNNLSTVFLGSIKDAAANRLAFITKIGTGTLTLGGNNNFTGSTVIDSGVLALTNSGTLSASTNIDVLGGATLNVSGRTDGTLTMNTNQNLTGFGTVIGNVTAGNGAIVSPDSNPNGGVIGTLTITGALQLQGGSSMNVDVDPANQTNDEVIGLTSVTYGGTLNVNNFSSYSLGNIIKLFNAGSYSGAFTNINPSVPSSGLGWDTSHLTTDGTLRVGLPHPTISGFSVSGTTMTLSGTGGTPNGDYSVLTSTNITNSLATWTLLVTTQFDNAGNFNVQVSTNAAQSFFILSSPP